MFGKKQHAFREETTRHPVRAGSQLERRPSTYRWFTSASHGSNSACLEGMLECCSGARSRRERRCHWCGSLRGRPGACHAGATASPSHVASWSELLTTAGSHRPRTAQIGRAWRPLLSLLRAAAAKTLSSYRQHTSRSFKKASNTMRNASKRVHSWQMSERMDLSTFFRLRSTSCRQFVIVYK